MWSKAVEEPLELLVSLQRRYAARAITSPKEMHIYAHNRRRHFMWIRMLHAQCAEHVCFWCNRGAPVPFGKRRRARAQEDCEQNDHFCSAAPCVCALARHRAAEAAAKAVPRAHASCVARAECSCLRRNDKLDKMSLAKRIQRTTSSRLQTTAWSDVEHVAASA